MAIKGLNLHRILTKRAKLGGVMTAVAFLTSACADMAVFHQPATMIGFATKPAPNVDFVQATHPQSTDYTSIGTETAHPPDKPRDAAGVKKLQSELEAQRDAGHAILDKLSPGLPRTDDRIGAQSSDNKKKKKANDDTDQSAAPKTQGQDQAPASE